MVILQTFERIFEVGSENIRSICESIVFFGDIRIIYESDYNISYKYLLQSWVLQVFFVNIRSICESIFGTIRNICESTTSICRKYFNYSEYYKYSLAILEAFVRILQMLLENIKIIRENIKYFLVILE